MPVQKTDRDTTWFIDQADKKWTLASKATISVDGQNGIYESVSGSEINVFGDIAVKGMVSGVRFQGPDSVLEIGQDSLIDARQGLHGIHAEGAGSDIVNNGVIRAGEAGIYGAIWSDIKNFGSISGKDGIFYEEAGSQIYNYGRISATGNGVTVDAAGSYMMNAKDAMISGDQVGVLVRDAGAMSLVNKGTIRSEGIAIESEHNDLTVRNIGKIIGDLALGGGDDVVDTRGGSIDGIVYGGDGDDVLITSSSKVKFQEAAIGGTEDRVISTASYKLAANVEQLILYGNRDIDGTGNDGDNKISGNEGDNVIRAKGGLDFLTGEGGGDALFGGAGVDVFFFDQGGDIDRIKDFVDGEDLLGVVGVTSYAEFAALDIRQTKSGVVIDLGGGDKLIIEDALKTDITFDDFYLV